MSQTLTMAQALTRYLTQQYITLDSVDVPFFAGVWAIFGHGNVAGLGEALGEVRDSLPTYRAHNEQGMAHAAIAYAKQLNRRRAFACTTSIGPGATNMVTAAALAHVNRLPVLFMPGDVYASRRPDPVLQQVEDFGDGTVSVNDCFRPVSRYFDRITRPEQILTALPRAMATLTDGALCGPVTLALCQDVQAQAYDYPDSFFERRVWPMRRPQADACDIAALQDAILNAKAPLMIVGGGVKYSGAEVRLAEFAAAHQIPLAETQAGKGAIVASHPMNLGAVGVTGTDCANQAARSADLIIGIGTRMQDFTTGSQGLFNPAARLMQVNINGYDAHKMSATPVIGDAGAVLSALDLEGYQAPEAWISSLKTARVAWDAIVDQVTAVTDQPTEPQILGALMRVAGDDAIVVAAAGGLPGDMHKFWRTRAVGGYHMEYGFSTMGYEIAGGLGVKLAEPAREVYVLVGDGSYLMMNSELNTAVMLGQKLIVILVDNGGYGCIHRLQKATGGQPFNNRLKDSRHQVLAPVDFVCHARSLGAQAERAATLAEFEAAIIRAKASDATTVIVIETEADGAVAEGGAWWDVAVPEVSNSPDVQAARARYDDTVNAIKGRTP